MGQQLMLNGQKVNIPAAKSKPAQLVSQLVDRLPGMIPAEVNKEQFLCALMAEVNQLPDDCTPVSVAKYAMNSAILGLISGQALGHCHAVPFRAKVGQKEVTMVIGYRGFIELALASGFLAGVTPELIFKGERYKRWNDIKGPQFKHEIDFDIRDQAKGLDSVVAAYALWRTHDGFHDVTMVAGAQLRSLAAKQRNVWEAHPLEMALKTPIRRASKVWKLTGRLALAVRLDEQAERGEVQDSLSIEPIGRREPSLSLSDLGGGERPRIAAAPSVAVGLEAVLRPLVGDRDKFDAALRDWVNANAKTEAEADDCYLVANQISEGVAS